MIPAELAARWEAAGLLCKEQTKSAGIGTLGEKALHRRIKYTVEPNDSYHEQPLGPYVADVVTAEGLVEVQTGSFFPLKKKLPYLLEQGPVRLIHPIAATKWLSWVDPVSGEVSPRRRSSKSGKPLDACYELARIWPLLGQPGLTVELWLLEVEEYRFLNGYGAQRKKRATRYSQEPLALLDVQTFHTLEDYKGLLPPLPQPFTCKELQKAAARSEAWARYTLYLYEKLGLLARQGKQGRAILYGWVDS